MTPLEIILMFAGYAVLAVGISWAIAYLSTRRPDSRQQMLARFGELLAERSRQRGGTPGPIEQALLDEYTPIKLSDYEVSGTVTTGVMVWCPECEDWFAHWTSRQQYPNVQQIVDECEAHSAERHPVTEEHQS